MSNKRNNIIVLAVAAVSVGFLLTATGAVGALLRPLQGVALRISAVTYRLGVGTADAFSPDEFAQCSCAADMQAELERLQLENSELQSTVSENQELKLALAFVEREKDRAVTARVVSESSDDTFSGLVIDRGSADGIREGQPVVAGDGVVIGKVRTVRERRSTVALLTDSTSRLAVSVQNGSDTLGVLEGDRGLSMSIALVPQHVQLSPGDTVVTSGIEPGIRRGLAVGTIEKIHKETQEPFQTATVRPFRTADHPIFVQVLLEAQEETEQAEETPSE